MAKKKMFDSYEAGVYDCQIEISGESTLQKDKDFTYPNEDVGELDPIQYIRGQIHALIQHLKKG